MADQFIKITIEGEEKLLRAIEKFPRQSAKYLQAAGKEAADRVIIPARGLKTYPPLTAANAPPTPYYKRGQGTQYASYNDNASQNLGKQWYTKAIGKLDTEIGVNNQVSYAKWVHGDEQARAMERIGWKKLTDVVKDKIADITKVYDAWVKKLLHDIGL